MKYRNFLRSGRRLWQSFRCFSDDPSKTFKDKGLAEENRYFMKKQEEELKRLRKQILQLTKNQQKLQTHLDHARKVISQLHEKKE